MNFLLLALALNIFASPPVKILTADLSPETISAFEGYVKASEARITQEERNPNSFLYFDQLPASQRSQTIASLKQGHVFIKRLVTLDASGHAFTVPGGLIHHWLGIVFIPQVTVRQTLDTVQDYNHQQDYYRPEVIRSRLIARQGNDFKVYLRLQEKKVITVTLDTDHDVRYTPLDANRWFSRSTSTRIQEVENAGGAGERLLPVGHDGGFLWRMNSYWWFEERDGGVYVQCESISLTRDIPAGFGWLVGSFVTSIPEESLEETLGQTRAAALTHL
ncbi:MAG: hypothetical protein ACRD2P_02830 [Terriglobia bacterium]